MSTIYDAAVAFQNLMNYEYKLVLGYKGKSTEIQLRFYEDKFYHLCGLHKLTDLSIVDKSTSTVDVLNRVLRGNITQEMLQSSRFFYSEHLDDRINRVADLTNVLNGTIRNKSECAFFKYNNNINPFSKIKASFMIKSQAKDDRTVYFLIDENRYDKSHYFGLSIFSRDLSDKSQKDFALGHTANTLLYVSRTPLTKDKQLDKSKEEILFKLPSYSVSSDSNVKIIKFESIPYGNGNAVAIGNPRTSFFGGIKDFFARIIETVKAIRELKACKAEISKLSEELERVKREYQADIDKKEAELYGKEAELSELSAKYNVALRYKNQALASNEKLMSLFREVNAILNANPELKAEYIKARDEFKKRGRSADNPQRTPPKTPPNKPKHHGR